MGLRLAEFGRGQGSIHLDDVQCTGDEERLTDCPYDPRTGDCSHFEDASVRCNTGMCTPLNWSERLIHTCMYLLL